jgi:ribose transport system permease protein
VTVMLFNRLIGQGWAEGQAVGVGILAGIGVGLAGGLVSGTLVTLGRVTPFIATLGGLVGYRSITLAIAEGGEVRSASSQVFPAIGNEGVPLAFLRDGAGQPLVVNWSVFAFLILALVGAFTLRRTVFGRNCVAVGANEEAARLAGVPTGLTKLMTYVGLGFLCGVAAVFVAGRLNSVSSSQVGNFYELDAIAAVAIGGTNMAGGKGTVVGTVLGVLIMAVISNLIQLHGVSPYWQGLVKGAIILLAVLLQRGRTEA